MVVDKFDITICKENVFGIIDCFEDSPIYDDVQEEYESMLYEAYERLDPKAVVESTGIETLPRDFTYKEAFSEVMYCILSVGSKISEWSNALFLEGNYLGGMLADAIADDMLFQMSRCLTEIIRNICKKNKKGVVARLEAPQDISMEVQKIAAEVTDAKKLIGVTVLDSYMFHPVKTTARIYLLDDNDERMNVMHDCSACPNLKCKQRNKRKIKIMVKDGGKSLDFEAVSGESLLDILKRNHVYLPAPCNGKGSCGKCKVKVLRGNVAPSKEDDRMLKEEEISAGYRLACRAYPRYDCIILLENEKEEEAEVLTEFHIDRTQRKKSARENGDAVGVIIDIGTTTIAMQLVYRNTGKVAQTYTAINTQRAYGADVISRIEASNNGKKDQLQDGIQKDILKGIHQLAKGKEQQLQKVVIGGNTTMIHLLMGYPCKTLGVAPFTPVNINTIKKPFGEIFEEEGYAADVTIFPGISTYVGGDIVSGLYALEFEKREKVSVLIDLGTNGEMAIGNKDRLLVTSTAAGPAFEGGNITCGAASVPGAITGVEILNGAIEIKTIQNAKAVGICGTGIVEAAYALLKEGIIDDTGLMKDEYFDTGFVLGAREDGSEIAVFQKDIREIQLAKAAVRAGLETLILRYGISYEEIEHVYIAGGFGYKMDIGKAVGIGLFPSKIRDKIQTVGNSCLSGTLKYLLENTAAKDVAKIVGVAREIPLSTDQDFNRLYIEHMYFEEQ